METKYDEIKGVPQFKYHRETIQKNGIETKQTKLAAKIGSSKSIFHKIIAIKKCTFYSKQTKLRHYNAFIKSKTIY